MKAKFHPVLKYCAGYTMPPEPDLSSYMTKYDIDFVRFFMALPLF